MIGRIMGFVLTGCDAGDLGLDFQRPLRGTRRSVVSLARESMPVCRFSMLAWPIWESFAFRPGFAKVKSGLLVLECVSLLRS
jgi:hypothetical protein